MRAPEFITVTWRRKGPLGLADPTDAYDLVPHSTRTTGEPERALMRAVLEDAVTRYRQRPIKGGKTSAIHWRIVQDEAVAWFAAPTTGYLFDFENVCEVLGLDAGYIRRELARGTMGVGQLHRYSAYRTGARGGTGRMVGRVSG